MRGGHPVDDEVLRLPVVDRGVVGTADIDFNDHMNVNVYLRILTTTTIRGLEYCGLGYDYAPKYHCGLFSVDHHARYLSELRLGAPYTTHVRLIEASDRGVRTVALLRDVEEQRIACSLESLLLNVDHVTRKVTPFLPGIAERLAEATKEASGREWSATSCDSIAIPGKLLPV
ncbi:thioesterase family protein [Arthrobacter sp. MA-N2]|uniref:thioesterase family protein n=1 Tax=Arthrobacter sp. MA-N2 TaxID=1101188 RepID=UPI0004B1AAAD|nr:thioesterase family protein [Arthrobacter sp. MA-N2]